MKILAASDRSLLITVGQEVSLESHRKVAHLTRALEGMRGVLNLHPAFASVLVSFDPRLRTHAEMEEAVRARIDAGLGETDIPERVIEMPVRYGGESGPDLEDVARHTGFTPKQVVELHSSAEYIVFFMGFATGFPYLGGLPPELATPRLSAPRKLVPQGSVAIGGTHAGVYPLPSPGGWRLIGHTDVRLFDPKAEPPPLLRMGDRIRFIPVREKQG